MISALNSFLIRLTNPTLDVTKSSPPSQETFLKINKQFPARFLCDSPQAAALENLETEVKNCAPYTDKKID